MDQAEPDIFIALGLSLLGGASVLAYVCRTFWRGSLKALSRDIWRWVKWLFPSLLIAAGIASFGLIVVVLLLDLLVNAPQSLSEFELLPEAALGLMASASICGLGALLAGHDQDKLKYALAVGAAVIGALVVLVFLTVVASWARSLLGHRGAVPQTLTGAYLTMLLIAGTVAAVLGGSLYLMLRWIARAPETGRILLPLGCVLLVGALVTLWLGLREDPTASQDSASLAERDAVIARHGSPEGPLRVVPRSEVLLALRYQPWLLFTPGDRKPLDVEAFLDERVGTEHEQQLCTPTCVPLNHQLDLPRHATDHNAVLHLDPDRSEEERARADRAALTRIYYHLVSHEGLRYLDYWIFYRFNDSPTLPRLTCVSGLAIADATCFDHEGDWEGVTVVLPASGNGDPIGVVYAAHDKAAMFSWAKLAGWGSTKGQRPKVWVARGSHASYPKRCGGRYGSCHQMGSDLPDGARGMVEWSGNRGVCEHDCVAPLPLTRTGGPAGWAAFGGRWGQSSCTLGLKFCVRSEGPWSPFFQKRYACPWAPERGRCSSSDE